MRRSRATVLVVAAIVILSGCAQASDSTLDETDEKLADVESAVLDLAFEARALQRDDATGPVGFRLQGPFSFVSDGRLPVADLRYTRLLGGGTEEASFISTGEEAYVRAGGRLTKLGPEQVESLQLSESGDDRGSGLDQLDLREWVDDPEETAGPRIDGVATRRITGLLDVAEALADVARLAAQLGAVDSPVGELSEDDRRQLARLADRHTVEVLTGKDGYLRRLRADMTFRPSTENQRLRNLTGATLLIRLDLSRVNEPVRVNAPE